MARKRINIRVGFDLKHFSESQQNLIRKYRNIGRELQGVGRSMSMSLSAPIAALGAVSVKTFADFEQSMAKVKAISGATGSAFKDLQDKAKELGISTRFSASQVSDLMLNYSKLGFSSSEIEKITESTLNLALATGEDLANSATVAGGTLRAFQLDASQMGRVTDVMAKSFSSSALDLNKFQVSMGTIAPVAQAMGQSLETTTAQLSVLMNNGIEASTAGTMLRNMMIKATKDGFDMEEALREIAGSTDKAETSLKFFDARATATAITLAENIDVTNQLTETYDGAAGAAKEMADIMDDTLSGSMLKLKSAAEGMAIAIGDKLAPHINKVADFIAGLAQGFAELEPETQQIIVTTLSLTAAIGPLVYAIGALNTALAFLIANPIVATVVALGAAIVALNIAASETNKIFDNVKTATDSMETAYNELSTAVDNLNRLKKQGLKASKDEIKLAIQSAKAKLKQAEAYFKTNMQRRKELALQKKESLQQALAATRGKQGAMQGEFIGVELAQTKQIEANILAIDEKLAKLTEQSFSAKDSIKELEAQLKQIENLKPSEKTFFGTTTGETKTKSTAIAIEAPSQKGIKNVTSQISEMANKAIEPVKIKIEPLSNQELDLVTQAQRIGMKMGEALSRGLQQLAQQGAVMLGEFIGNALTADKSAKDFGENLLGAVGGFMSQFGQAMVAIGIAESAIAKSIALGPAGAPIAIAGGIALIAAGTALSNLSKKGIQMDGGGGPSPSPTGAGLGTIALQPISLETKISGRDLILVQNREKGFTR